MDLPEGKRLTLRTTDEVLRYEDIKNEEQWKSLSIVEKNLIHYSETHNLIKTLKAFAEGVKKFGSPPVEIRDDLYYAFKAYHETVTKT